MNKTYLLLACLWCSLDFGHSQSIQFSSISSGFNVPVDISSPDDGSFHLYITEKRGMIIVIDSFGARIDTLLDIQSFVNTGGEQGLLSLAFHPHFANNGIFYINYCNLSTNNVLVEYDLDNYTSTPVQTIGTPLLTINQPRQNHNASELAFGPDGALYWSVGDGGKQGDPDHNAQNPLSLLGKILRINVEGNGTYNTIGNPYHGSVDTLPEIWALGVRSPWKFSFDRLTGDFWLGDVGQVTKEEVSVVEFGASGINLGWNCFEGNFPHNPSCTSAIHNLPEYIPALLDFDRSVARSITGGFVYRGTRYPDLIGKYFVAEYINNQVWYIQEGCSDSILVNNLADIVSFGERSDGELFASNITGSIYQIHDATLAPSFQNIIYVDSSATGNESGNSWSNAMTDLQRAIDWAYSKNLDSIFIAKGTYFPSTCNLNTASLKLQGGENLFGGFPSGGSSFSNRDPVNNPTCISGDIGVQSINSDNLLQVIEIFEIQDGIELNGIQIEKGKDSAGSAIFLHDRVVTDTIKLVDCQFSGHESNSIIYNRGNMIIENCQFSQNILIGPEALIINDNGYLSMKNCTIRYSSNQEAILNKSTGIINIQGQVQVISE